MNIVSQAGRFLIALIFILSLSMAYIRSVQAADYPKLSTRSLTIGDVTPGAITDYRLSWQYPAATTIGSVRLLMCTNGEIDDVCVSPNGDMSSAILTSQSGITGFSINSQSANEILLTRGPAAASTVQSTYDFSTVTNPTGLPQKFFIRILTYPSGDGTGVFNHASSVVNTTTRPIVITTEVPPILFFCAGISIDLWCENVIGNQIDYGDLSAINGDYGISQFGVATNAPGGYAVTINGNTMTSGTRIIPELNTPTAFTTGTPQFGLNLRANTLPAAGQDPNGLGISTASTGYDTPDVYQFNDGDVVATAVTGTLFDIFTATYIVNVPANQASGVYNTTIAYICTAAF